jgi:hypothetical protein
MNSHDLPKDVVERVERRWIQKLQQQALAWKGARSDTHTTTDSGVPVVRRPKRKRRLLPPDAAA